MSRKKNRAAGASAAPKGGAPASAHAARAASKLVDDTDPYLAFEGRDWGFHFLPDDEPVGADEKALHLLMRDWRHGRASRRLSQVIGDAYVSLFSLAIIGGMIVNLLLNQQANAAGCATDACQAGRTVLPWAVLCAIATLTLSAARIFGPVLASAAEGFWLMDAPVSRTRLLGGRLVAAIAIAFLASGLVASLLALLAGTSPVGIAGWAVATGATSAALIALGAVEQTHERTIVLRVLQALFGLAAASAVGLIVAIGGGHLAAPSLGTPTVPWLVAAGGGVLLVVLAVLAFRRLDQIRRARLLSGGSLVSGMQGAMFALDLGLARDILVEREAVERGHVKPTLGKGVGVQALIWRDWQRLLRFPKPLLGLVAAGLVPYGADALGLGFLMPFLAALALVFAMVPLFGSLRVLSRTGGLARLFPFSTTQLRQATMVLPSILAGLWAIAMFPAVVGVVGGLTRPVTEAMGVCLSIGLAGLLGSMRWVTGKAVDFNRPMMATNAGAMPPSLIFNLFRGIDVAATVTAPIMLNAPSYWSLGIAAIWFAIITNGKSMEELQEEGKEARQELEAEKAARQAAKTGEKIKVSRPQR